jgi:hypothetical protein
MRLRSLVLGRSCDPFLCLSSRSTHHTSHPQPHSSTTAPLTHGHCRLSRHLAHPDPRSHFSPCRRRRPTARPRRPQPSACLQNAPISPLHLQAVSLASSLPSAHPPECGWRSSLVSLSTGRCWPVQQQIETPAASRAPSAGRLRPGAGRPPPPSARARPTQHPTPPARSPAPLRTLTDPRASLPIDDRQCFGSSLQPERSSSTEPASVCAREGHLAACCWARD